MPDRTHTICKRCGQRSGKITTTWRHGSGPFIPVQAQWRCDRAHIWYSLVEWQAVIQNYATTIISDKVIIGRNDA